MSSFKRADYEAVFAFARAQYYWHESTGRGHAIKAALVMEKVEEVIGQQTSFPGEARERLSELTARFKRKLWEEMR